ncbi:MAG TPA: trypsin-like peptidase domain-containing protein, partial [Thermomicrobiales bacterium]|nr:trypsin-like peptidase domain-containing protein [Thermomicrobiales bacterium]
GRMGRPAGMTRLARRAPLIAYLLVVGVALAGCTLPGQAAPTPVPTATPLPPQATAPPPPPSPAAAPRDLTPQEVFRRVGPAVVTVVDLFTQNGQSGTAFGTGIIFDARGYIITNNHVIEGQQRLKVIFQNGAERDARLVGADPLTDLAVLKVDGDVPGTATFGDSAKLEPGQPVVAIGSALGEFTNTVTTGIISGLHRQLPRQDEPDLEGMIQTDAAINPGNSGGPLLNLQGEVVGVNTAVVRQSQQGANVAEGLGFAIPANLAKVIGARLIADGKVIRADLGATTVAVTPGLALQQSLPVQQGAYVKDVAAGGPAAQAGIQAQDVIVAIEGKPVDEETSLAFLLLAYHPGDQVTVIVARGQERRSVRVTLGQSSVVSRQSSVS